jgi:hypothetical protein
MKEAEIRPFHQVRALQRKLGAEWSKSKTSCDTFRKQSPSARIV